MESIVLRLNNMYLPVSFDCMGTIFVSNNAEGNKLVCMVTRGGERMMYKKLSLALGKSIEVEYLSGGLSANVFSEKEYYVSTESIFVKDVGIELQIGDKILSAPFQKNGSLSVVVTVVKGKVIVNFGGITAENELLDYYYGQMVLNDRLIISLKNLEQISKPFNVRIYKNGNCSI